MPLNALSMQTLENAVYERYHVDLDKSQLNLLASEIDKAYGASLDQSDIQKALKNPYSQINQTAFRFVAEVSHQKYQEDQQALLLLIQQLRETLAVVLVKYQKDPDTYWGEKETIQYDIRGLEAELERQAQEDELLEQMRKEYQESFFQYFQLSERIIAQDTKQRDKLNAVIRGNGLAEKFELTQEKQAKLHDLFEKTNGNAESVNFEIQYMSIMLNKGENENLKPSEVAALAKAKAAPGDPNSASLYSVLIGGERENAGVYREMKAQEAKIFKLQDQLQNAVEREARQDQSNVLAQYKTTFSPQFFKTQDNDELLKRLEQLYNFPSPPSLDPNSAFQFRLEGQLRQMSPELQEQFLTQFYSINEGAVRGHKPLNESQLNILGIVHTTVNEVMQAQSPEAEAEAEAKARTAYEKRG
jgi:hypothetical protein